MEAANTVAIRGVNDLPSVSIVIPCYNASAHVRDAIDSALSQSYEHCEVVAVDDGSTDDTLKVLKQYQDRVKVSSGPNRGACAARNEGLKIASGAFIQFLDADDVLHPKKIEQSLAVFPSGIDALVFTYHRVETLDPGKVDARDWNRVRGEEDAVAFMLAGDLPTPAPLHRKSVLDRLGGYQEGLPCAQDREFHMRLALSGIRFVPVRERLFTIRRRAGSVGTASSDRLNLERGRIARMAYERLKAENRLTEEYAVRCAAMMMKAARGLARSQRHEAERLRREALSLHPSGGVDLVYSPSARALLSVAGIRVTEECAHMVRRVRRSLARRAG